MPTPPPPGAFCRTAALAALLLGSGCDIPTEPPAFELTTGIRAPLLLDKTFVLLGPSDSGHEALIDTTASRFDSVFTVDAASRALSIVQEIDGFETELPAGVLPTLAVNPIDVVVSARDLYAEAPAGESTFPYQPQGEPFSWRSTVPLQIGDASLSAVDDYVELGAGTFHVEDLRNELDVAFDDLMISVPALRRSPYRPSDSLVIRFRNLNVAAGEGTFRMIDRKSGPRHEQVDLSGYRLYAAGNELSYNVYGRTETTEEVRIVRDTERLHLTVLIEDADVAAVAADLEPLEVDVSDDADGDGRLDVLNDHEADVAGFGGLSLFEELEVDGFQLSGSELRLRVRSNIAADFSLYAAIAGVRDDGEPIYLEGRGSASVDAADPAAGRFAAAGTAIDPRHLVRLEIRGADSPKQPVDYTIVFDARNSNIDAFLSHVPSELRMATHLVVQPGGGHVQLREPLLLETSFGVRIPLSVTGGFNVDKAFDADLSDLEDVSSDSSEAAIDEAELELGYVNALPLGLDLRIDVLDSDGGTVASFPKPDQSMHVLPASVGETGFSEQPSEGTFSLSISRSDLEAMSHGRRVRVRFALTTDGDRQATLRASDAFTMRLRGRFGVRIRPH